MRAIVIARPGGPDVLELRDVPLPTPIHGHVRVRIRASAVNRADVMQRLGRYPAPPGSPKDIPGLEIAGEVDAIGEDVTELAVGDRVFGVVGGGGYAEAVVVHARTLAKMPPGIDFAEAAAIPEAFVTAYDAMVVQGALAAGERVLVHAVGSGVGTAAIQIARAIGARSIGTARTAEKLERAKELGLDRGLVQGDTPRFAADLRDESVHLVLDLVGGAYFAESLLALGERGRIVLVGLLAGARADVDLGLVLRKRLVVRGTMLRSRPLEEKILAAQVLAKNIAPLLAAGRIRPVVDRVMPLDRAGDAHRAMESNAGFGKIVLTV